MRKAFQRSLRVHAAMIRQGLRHHDAAPLTANRLARLGLGLPPYFALQVMHWAGLVLDEVLFPGYRATPVSAPVFIVGIPRSGTTFAHRTLAGDDAYTTLSTWEALLAPSISERRLWQALARLDARLGGPAARLIERAVRTLTGDLDDIHTVTLNDAEEDYLAMLPAAGCFILALAFPGVPALWALGRMHDELDDADRAALLDYYDGILRRHLYAHGGRATLLSKNAAFASWVGALATRYPDARFLVCVREPVPALSSQLSAITPAHTAFATDPRAGVLPTRFVALFTAGYAHLRDQVAAHGNRMRVVDFEQLQRAPGATLGTALHALGITTTRRTREALARADAQARTYRSRHRHDIRHFAVDAQACRAAMQPDFEALLRSAPPPQREVS